MMKSNTQTDRGPTRVQALAAGRVARANYALLRHVRRTPDFACHVRKFTVRAYSLFEDNHVEYEIGEWVRTMAVVESSIVSPLEERSLDS